MPVPLYDYQQDAVDRLKNGVGDLLISGTPRMQPNRALEDIYARKKYFSIMKY